jgi:hypothetical protein
MVGRNHYKYGIFRDFSIMCWLTGGSGYWRDCKLCGIRLCTGHLSNAFGSSQCLDWVCRVRWPHTQGLTNRLSSAVLGAYFLDERLGVLGKIGCAICLIGSVIIVLHAPADKDIETIDELLHLAIQPGELCLLFLLEQC